MARSITNASIRAMNRLFFRAAGGLGRPAFYDIDRTYPALRQLDAAFPAIKHELLAVLRAEPALPQYFELDRRQRHISTAQNPDKSWRVFLLYAMGEKPSTNRRQCPRTAEALDRIPGLFQAFFSILDPGKSIPAHRGSFLGYLRYHLALLVPTDCPPHIRVKDQMHTWREGESVLFDDSWEHEVTNHSAFKRVVLIVDVLRPLPWGLHALNVVFAWLARAFYARRMVRRMKEFDADAALPAIDAELTATRGAGKSSIAAPS
jgi:aspartyl/asparaginyl beta-hydroxylase (cupin superfamily)